MEHELTWGLPVVLYLFLAGLGAGAVTISASVLLRSGDYHGGSFFKLARYGALIGPVPVILGTCFIIFELGRWDRAFNLFKVINLSPMSIGSWLLVLFIFCSLIYAFVFLPSFLPRFAWLSRRLFPIMHALSWVNVPLGIGVAVYTGILLGAMPSRPLWNSPILALLFLVSALSTGIAIIILAQSLFHHRKDPTVEAERRIITRREATLLRPGRRIYEIGYILTAFDALLISSELIVIFLFVMFAHLTVGNLKYAMAIILPGGEMAAMFWVWVVLVGLLIPGLLEMAYVIPKVVYQREFRIHQVSEILISVAVLIGGFMLRYIIVIAGQITGPLGV
jgi:formate-dependent nitrite reductase membrane component NrfD